MSVAPPLHVDFVPRDGARGRLGLTAAPGRRDLFGMAARDLDVDLECLRRQHACDVLVGLVEDHELAALAIVSLPDRCRAHAIGWLHRPIPDGGAPAPEQLAALVDAIAAELNRDRTVIVHCRAGLGRSGLVAAAVLVAEGCAPEDAQARVRAARPGAIETRVQEQVLRAFAAQVRARPTPAPGD